jgi:hypothetical protein
LLGVEPEADDAYYVGFKVGNQNLGLDPNGHKEGMTVYYHVDDIKKSLKSLVDAGAKQVQEIQDVGGGGLIASVKDEKKMRIPFSCHFDASLCDVFIERQKQPRIYITGVQNEYANSQQIHHGLYRSQ